MNVCEGCQLNWNPLDRGVVNRLWFGSRWSNCPLVLCTASQEHLLQSYVGCYGWLCQLWPVEASKVGRYKHKIGENLGLRGVISMLKTL